MMSTDDPLPSCVLKFAQAIHQPLPCVPVPVPGGMYAVLVAVPGFGQLSPKFLAFWIQLLWRYDSLFCGWLAHRKSTPLSIATLLTPAWEQVDLAFAMIPPAPEE